MPRYDYRCESCRAEFELVQSFAEAGNGTCPACSGKGQRVYHAVPVIYKGSGFYTTDYGRPKPPSESKGSSNSDSSDSTSTGDSKSSSDTKSDTKSDTPAKSTNDSSASPTSDSSNTPSSTSASST